MNRVNNGYAVIIPPETIDTTMTLHVQHRLSVLRKLHKLAAKDVLPNINRTQAADRAEKCHLLSLMTLTFDLDIQTRPRKGPNMSSLWIWRKSIQRFPRYFIHKQESHRQRQKQNLMQFTACDNNVYTLTVWTLDLESNVLMSFCIVTKYFCVCWETWSSPEPAPTDDDLSRVCTSPTTDLKHRNTSQMSNCTITTQTRQLTVSEYSSHL